ncbi:helix-turn-helix domain-containing protein [Kineococcus gynurae]|uniref:Helix-turn-helix domain-containing protein n=1 Tax=Kineococcus gynurae TaxID=452979 RepID=A0ABV5LXM7_9ACTN
MDDALQHVGPRLRAARTRRGWTLEDLAGRTAMSVSTLSRLESGKRQAGLELLLPLTRQLGISLDDLVRTAAPDPRVRRATMQRNGLAVTPLTPEGSPVAAWKITYPPGGSVERLRVHEGFEWLYVLSGKLRLRLGEQDLVLDRGEAAEFDTRVPHAMAASGPRPAQVLSIFDETGARMHTHSPDPI